MTTGQELIIKALKKTKQKDLADRLCCTQQYVSMLARGKRKPGHDMAIVCRDVLRIPLKSWA
jgi:transcriptional regulator with XRE-family HTH domain